MKSKIRVLILSVFLAILALFPACTSQTEGDNEHNDNVTYSINSISGFIQKGPFIQGSTVTIHALNKDFSPTGLSYPTETTDDFGSFGLKSKIDKDFVDIRTTGFYFNEVKGSSSTANLTLKTLSSLKNEINVNILTTLERERIKYLMNNENIDFKKAQSRAEEDILNIFGIKKEYVPENLDTFDSMDVSKSGDSNAVLLAVSVTLQGDNTVAGLSSLISKITADIKSDGTIDDTILIDKLKHNSKVISGKFIEKEYIGLNKIRRNIEDYYIKLGLNDVNIPEFELYTDSDADGLINKYDAVQMSPVGNIGANGAIGESVLVLDWSDAMIDDAKYSVELAISDKFDKKSLLGRSQSLSNSEYTVKTKLKTDTKYYWRVAIHEGKKQMPWCGVAEFNIISNAWVKLQPEIDGESFEARSAHSMVYTKNNKLIMFGGAASDSILDETWEYDIDGNKWTELFPETEHIDSLGRSGGDMAYVDKGQVIYFGGYNGENYLNDTLMYDIKQNKWIKLNPKVINAEKLRGRSMPSMTYTGNRKIIMVGGVYQYWGMDETWEYDVDANTWTKLEPEIIGGELGERQISTVGYIGDGKVILFGGFYSGTHYDELWEYDIDANTWTKLEATVAEGKFAGRNTHSMVYAGFGKMIMYGGESHSAYYLQTWELDLDAMEWRKVNGIEDEVYPEISSYTELCYIGNGKLIMYGGRSRQIPVDETWIYYMK